MGVAGQVYGAFGSEMMTEVWTSEDADALQRYESLPAELQLRSYLGLVNPTPTGWIPVLRDTGSDGVRSTLTSVLVGPESLGSAMADAGWSTRGLGMASNDPSARKGFAEGLIAHEDGYEAMFFVHARHHHGLVAPTIELTPSFVWWLELIPSGDGQWIRLDSAGRSHEVVKTSRPDGGGYEVMIDAGYLRRYLAARGLSLMIQHRHTVWSDIDDVDRIDLEIRNDVATLEFCATESIGGTRHNFFADLLGKHVVVPFSQAGTDPDDPLRPERFREFIVGVDPATGDSLRLSCDDSAREGQQNYLKSAFFDTDVLTRYRDDPKRYVLSRNQLWCLDLWGLDIDINDAGLVHVWLGDLRRLPEAERDHWLLHNVAPRGGISEIRFRRDILNQWVADERPDLTNLRRAKTRLNDAVRESFGVVDIFRPLTDHDGEAFQGLSLCTNPTVAQRDLSILTLAKGVVECLDVKQLRKLAGASDAEPSLNCLTAWLETIGGDSEELCAPLRLLQNLRSTGASHLRGSKYDAVIASAGWQTTPPDKQFQQLVGDLTDAFNKIADLVESDRGAPP